MTLEVEAAVRDEGGVKRDRKYLSGIWDESASGIANRMIDEGRWLSAGVTALKVASDMITIILSR